MKKWSVFAVVVFAVLLSAVGVSAQSTPTPARSLSNPIVITEETINDTFRVTNPPGRRVDNLVVDLQPGQVVDSFDFTIRAPRGQSTTTYAVVATYQATVTNGRIYWNLVSATADGEAASATLISQINTSVSTSWRNYIHANSQPGRVVSVTITDTEIQIAYEAR